MSAKHTPGPWAWRKPIWDGWKLEGADGSTVADDGSAGDEYSPTIDPDGDEREQANARLIAAAPDLLDALKDIVELASSANESALIRMAKKAQAAIAKAEGRT